MQPFSSAKIVNFQMTIENRQLGSIVSYPSWMVYLFADRYLASYLRRELNLRTKVCPRLWTLKIWRFKVETFRKFFFCWVSPATSGHMDLSKNVWKLICILCFEQNWRIERENQNSYFIPFFETIHFCMINIDWTSTSIISHWTKSHKSWIWKWNWWNHCGSVVTILLKTWRPKVKTKMWFNSRCVFDIK